MKITTAVALVLLVILARRCQCNSSQSTDDTAIGTTSTYTAYFPTERSTQATSEDDVDLLAVSDDGCHAYVIDVDPLRGTADPATCSPFFNDSSVRVQCAQVLPKLTQSGEIRTYLSGTYRDVSVDKLSCCQAAGKSACSRLATAFAALHQYFDGRLSENSSDFHTVFVRLQAGQHVVDSDAVERCPPLDRGHAHVVILSAEYANGTLPMKSRPPTGSLPVPGKIGEELPNGFKADLTVLSTVLRCSAAATNGTFPVLFNISSGAMLSLLGFEVTRCNFSYAFAVATDAKITSQLCIFRDCIGQVFGTFDSDLTLSGNIFYNVRTRPDLSQGDMILKGDPSWQAGAVFFARTQSQAAATIKQELYNITASALIEDCRFELCGCFDYSRRAEQQVETGFIDGAATGFLFRTGGSDVKVVRTSFISNRVCGRGGGIYMYFADQSSKNSVKIVNCLFHNNSANEEGAGLSIKFVATCLNNSVLVQDSVFSNNTANSAAGTDVLFDNIWTSDGVTPNTPSGRQRVHFLRTQWRRNFARIAAPAMRVRGRYAYHRYASRLIYEDCQFIRNHAGSSIHSSSFLAVQANIEFYGKDNLFEHNQCTGLVLETANAYIEGNITFRNNFGYLGGGLCVRLVSQLYMARGASLGFYGNMAKLSGGGLHWEGPPAATRRSWFRYNPDCVFIYAPNRQAFPETWEFNVKFVNNSAVESGAAVYASALSLCSWFGYKEEPFWNISTSLRWSFMTYQDNYLQAGPNRLSKVPNDISTSPYRLHLLQKPVIDSLPPGDSYPVNIEALDELDQPLVATAFINTNQSGVVLGLQSFMTSLSSKLSPDVVHKNSISSATRLSYTFQRNVTADKLVFTFDLRNSKVFEDANDEVLVVRSTQCPRGFTLKCTNDECSCVCETIDSKGLLYCTHHHIFVLKENYFVATMNDSNDVAIVPCPQGYCTCRNNLPSAKVEQAALAPSLDTVPIENLYSCLVDVNLITNATYQCNSARAGRLCGDCVEGSSVSLHSFRCLDCRSDPHWLGPILVFVTLVAVLILAKVRFFISSRFLALVLYCQTVQRNHLRTSESNWVVDVGIPVQNFISFRWWFSLCFKSDEDIVDLYLYSLLPLVVLLVAGTILFLIWIFQSRRLLKNPRTNPRYRLRPDRVIYSMVHLSLLIYGETIHYAFQLFHCVPIMGKYYLYGDGERECFVGEHAVWGTIGVLIVIFVGIGFPVLATLLALGKLRLLKKSNRVSWLLSRDLREGVKWWWGAEFAIRLFLECSMALWTRRTTMTVVIIPLVLALITVNLVQPYQSGCDSFLMAAMLGNLAVVQVLRSPNSASLLDENGGFTAYQAVTFWPYCLLFLMTVHWVFLRARSLYQQRNWKIVANWKTIRVSRSRSRRSRRSRRRWAIKSSWVSNRHTATRPARPTGRKMMTAPTERTDATLGTMVMDEDHTTSLRDPLLENEMWQLEHTP